MTVTFSQPNVQLDLRPMLPTEHKTPPEIFIISNGDLIAFHLLFLPFVNMIPTIHYYRHVTQFAGSRGRKYNFNAAEPESEAQMRYFALSAKFRRAVVQYIQLEMKPEPYGRHVPRSCSMVSQRGCEAYFKASLERWREVQKLIHPSTTIVLHPDDINTEVLQATTFSVRYSYHIDDTLFSNYNKAVFFMKFQSLASFSSVDMLQAPSKGHLVCIVCENGAAEYNTWLRLRGYITNAPFGLIPRHDFECSSKEPSSCWLVMSWTLEEAAQGGKRVFWELSDTTVTSLRSYCVKTSKTNPNSKPILGDWSVANQMDYTLSRGSNFSASFQDFSCYASEFRLKRPKEHVFDSLLSRSRHLWMKQAISVSLSPELSTDEMENLVYVTEVGVELSNSAIDLYLNPMESPVWCAFLGALLLGCTAFATLSSFELRKRNGSVTWSWSRWVHKFGQMFRFLGELFVDQCNSELPVRHRTTAVVWMVLPWLLAILIATNGFKSFFKARFLQPFPYKLVDQTRWQDFVNYSIFIIDDPSLKCDCAFNGRNIQLSSIEEANMMKLSNSPVWECRQFIRKGTLVRKHAMKKSLEERNPFMFGSNTLWSKGNSFWILGVVFQAGLDKTKLNETTIKKLSEWRTAATAITEAERICRYCLDLFIGFKYQEAVTKHKNLLNRLFSDGLSISLNLTEELKANVTNCPRDLRKSGEPNDETTAQQEHFVDLFWANQKHQAAFLIPADQFAWQWNLFKKRMRDDRRFKFAFIGPKTLKTSLAQHAESNPTNSHTYISRQFQYETWMARRIAALHSSGLLDFWNKWHYILRNLVREFMAAEVDEQDKQVKPLAVADPSLQLLFSAVYITLLCLILLLLLEVFVNGIHLVDVDI